MARPQTKNKAAKKTTEIVKANGMNPAVKPSTFQIELHQGTNTIIVKMPINRAKVLIRAVHKRNLKDYPLTVIDVDGTAHILRHGDRASFPSELLSKDDMRI